MRKTIFFVALLSATLSPTQALAHVTVQPNEAIVGSFARFVVRVPNERPDASTTKVKLTLPPLAFVSFEPKEGWTRKERMVELDEPIEAFGQEITEVVGSVTWSGGKIAPGEFDEFGFSARMPDSEEVLEFSAEQTYSSGDVVAWVGTPDSEEPAARLTTYDIGTGEDEGELAALAKLVDEAATQNDAKESNTEDKNPVPLILSIVALAVSIVALFGSRRGSA